MQEFNLLHAQSLNRALRSSFDVLCAYYDAKFPNVWVSEVGGVVHNTEHRCVGQRPWTL